MIVFRRMVSCLFGLALSMPAWAADYHVGPGQALSTIGDAPWASLLPGDRVLIHWRASPCNEKWVINRRGTPEAWITIRGVSGPEGQLPVIDGRDTQTVAGLNFWNEERGVIKVGGSNTPPDGARLPGDRGSRDSFWAAALHVHE